MAVMDRKSVGFSPSEVAQIQDVVEDSEARELLDDALFGGLVLGVLGLDISAGAELSFSDAVRRLALIGLREIRQKRLTAQYEAMAPRLDELFPEKALAAMGASSARAIAADRERASTRRRG
jgi:hypothetical protein